MRILLIILLAVSDLCAQSDAATDARWLQPEETVGFVALPPVPVNFRRVVYSPPIERRVEPKVPTASYCDAAVIKAARQALKDNAPGGWCGRGVYNVLSALGLGSQLESVNGQEWPSILKRAGWRPVKVSDPKNAPHLSVLVYDSDVKRHGRNIRGTKGGTYGHVELVLLSSLGERWYIADEVRFKPGGTVLDNFTGIAWVPPFN